MSGCSNRPTLHESEQAVLADKSALIQLNEWRIKGKIAWITPQERTSAYINWDNEQDSAQLVLTNVLGISLANMSYDPQLATLNADGETYTDINPERLIARTTGWQIPIAQLQYWIKGIASPQQKQSVNDVKYNEDGSLNNFTSQCPSCDKWKITYSQYKTWQIKESEYRLPAAITLVNLNSQAQLKLRISQWSESRL